MPHKPPFLPSALGLLMMLVLFALHFIKPLATLFPYPWNFLGLLPITIGALLSIVAERELQRAGAAVAPLERSSVLVERGVYRLSRNPMYLGYVLIGTGLAIWIGSLSPWLALPFFAAALHKFFIRPEERQLHEEHGADYEEYCRRVPRWLGRSRDRSEAPRS